MRAVPGIAIVALGGFAACTLTTDLDGFAGGGDDSAAPAKTPDGGVVPEVEDAGEGGAACDTDSDPHNCGVCGKDCLGGECKGGKCGQSVLASGFDRPYGIGLSQNKLYVGDGRGLHELGLDGKELARVVTDLRPEYVWGTDTDVFFSEANDLMIHRWSHTTDGSAPAVTDRQPGLEGVAAGGGYLYFTRYQKPEEGGGVYRVPFPAGGEPEKMKPWNKAECVAFADGKVYFAGDGQDSANALHDDGTVDPLLTRGGPTGIFILGDDAFITRQAAGQVLRVSLSTKESETLADDLGAPSGIVATPTAVYWAEADTGKVGVIVR
jgi:hypothetical protein